MKLRILALLMATAFIISGLYGCVKEEPPIDDHSSAETSAESSEASLEESSDTSDSSDTSEEITEPPVEPDYFTKNGYTDLPKASSVPQAYEKTETEHLYALNLDLPDTEGFNCTINGDYLYLSYHKRDKQLCRAYSLATGEFLAEFERPAWGAMGKLNNGGLWMIDYSSLKIEFVSPNGEKELKYEDTTPDEYYVNNAIVTPDGKYALISYGSQTSPFVIDIEKGKKYQPDKLSSMELYNMEIYEGKILISLYDGISVYNPATEELTVLTEANGVGRFFGGLYVTPADNALILCSTAQDEKFFMPIGYSESISDIDFGYAVTEDYFATRTYNFYNLRNSTLDAQVVLSPESYGSYAELLDNGRVFITDFTNDNTAVYIFDLPEAVKNSSKTQITSYLCAEAELQEQTKAIADKVYVDYGIELLYFSQGNDFIIYDYVGVAELDSFKVHLAVQETADILSKYPKNMLREVYQETHKGMKFYLCGTLYGVANGSISNAGAVTTEDGDYIIIAFDISSSLKYNIPHELSHAFDRRINYVYNNGGADWMQIWVDATPVRKAYTYSYDEYEKNMDYTCYGEYKEEKIWFVDAYSRTFPTEDRARIMEYLFNPESDGLASQLQAENLIYKARLYSFILRECFPSCKNEDTLYWETYLGTIDSSVLPQQELD